jgi:CRP-like cAMP-binding protein
MNTARNSGAAAASNLLRALKPHDLALLVPHLKSMEVKSGTVLYEPGDPVQHAYFPCGSTLLSFVVLLDDEHEVETALIGREGAVGGMVSQGHLPAYCRATVRLPGPVLRIESAKLEQAKTQSLALRHFFARYADCLMAQIFQSVACNATHTIEQRTAKWLMTALTHTNDQIIPLTQEQLAGMLGVGRSYVGRVMGSLKSAGVLETSRGKFEIRKLEQLAELACGCNTAVREHFDEVLAGVYPEETS